MCCDFNYFCDNSNSQKVLLHIHDAKFAKNLCFCNSYYAEIYEINIILRNS